MSIGDAIMGLMYGNPMQQAVQPQPGPQGGPPAAGGPGAGGGGPAAAGGAPGGPQAQPQPQAYQSPPDLAQMYLRLYQQDRSANEFDRGLALMAGGFRGPPGGAQTIMNSVGPPQDPGALMQNILQLRMQQGMMNSMQGGGLATMSQQSGIPLNVLQMGMYTDPKGTMDKVNDAIKIKQGVPAQLATQESQAKDVEAFKNSGIEDFTAANTKLSENEARVNQLLNDMPSTMQALAKPDVLTTSKGANLIPSGTPLIGTCPEAKQQAIAIDKLEAELTGEGLSTTKNVRNQREFGTLGEALTAGLNVNNGQQWVQQALQDIQKKFAAAHAQVYAVAGKQIPAQYAGQADPRYTSRTLDGAANPYYTGASYENDFSGMKDADIDAAVSALPKGANFIGPDGQPHTKR